LRGQALAAVCPALAVVELPRHVPARCLPVQAPGVGGHLRGVRVEGGCSTPRPPEAGRRRRAAAA